jgi:FkbM family methyltransferase
VRGDVVNDHRWYGPISYAQHGDDMALLNIFWRLGIERGTYVDVGAHHPYDLSNTALLYNRGWSGVLVEANQEAIPLLRRHRPDDTVVWAACVGKRQSGDKIEFFRAGPMDGLNSIHEGNQPSVQEKVTVPAFTLQVILETFCEGNAPDLLSIDAEGADADILLSIRSQMGAVIIIEARSHASDIESTIRMWADNAGYFLHSWAGYNMILVRNDVRRKVL